MPYKKRYKKKFKRRNNNTATTLGAVAKVANTALNIGKFVASVINVEHKYIDAQVSEVPSITVPRITPIMLISQGLDNTNRIGRSIRGKYVQVKYRITKNPSSAYNIMKVCLVVDKKTDGGLPTMTDILSPQTELGHRNIDFGARFQILHSKVHTLSDNTVVYDEFYIDLDKYPSFNHIEFDGVSGILSDVSAHPIYMIAITSDSTNLATIDWKSRYRFIDN